NSIFASSVGPARLRFMVTSRESKSFTETVRMSPGSGASARASEDRTADAGLDLRPVQSFLLLERGDKPRHAHAIPADNLGGTLLGLEQNTANSLIDGARNGLA